MADQLAVIGIDVGGTAVKGGLFLTDGNPVKFGTVASPPEGGKELVAATSQLIEYFQAFARGHGVAVAGAGVLAPGIVDDEAGWVLYAANLGWEDVQLSALLKASTGLPIAIGHDVRGASEAEHLVGAAQGAPEFVFVSLGTGISCALTVDGITRTGSTRAAGELGHIPVMPGGELCSCGQQGCLEVYASAAGMTRRYHAAGGDPKASAATIASRVGIEELAGRIWEEGTTALSLAMTSLILLVDPALILFGGGLSLAGKLLVEPVAEKMAAHLRWREAPPLRISSLGPHAGTFGGAILAMQAFVSVDTLKSWALRAHREFDGAIV